MAKTDPRETPELDLMLHPHRSLSPTGFWILMSVLAGLSFAGGIVFWSIGAWPVIGFVGVDVMLVYIAFRASYAGGRAYEQLRLSPEALLVRRVSAGGIEETYTFQPYWLRVEIEAQRGRQTRLMLISHGRSLAIGTFLAPEERAALARTLRAALARLKQAPAAM
ncbi:MAG: DUF2244 domain-containing protein [Proteobacteria bacterium]|nr:DUF2244 domain-containing protein [Pseudomonadota bacterium]